MNLLRAMKRFLEILIENETYIVLGLILGGLVFHLLDMPRAVSVVAVLFGVHFFVRAIKYWQDMRASNEKVKKLEGDIKNLHRVEEYRQSCRKHMN